MRWPWRCRAGRPTEEAHHAAWEALRGLQDVQALTARAEDVARRLDETRRRNHFAEAIAASMRRG
jgi:hypothetical protein